MTSSNDCPWRLVVSDMDGTLISGTTALAHLSAWLGQDALVDKLEQKLAQGQISDREVANLYALSYRDVTLADAVNEMSRIPSVTDIGTGVAMLHSRSIEAVIATVSWSFAARALADLWGFSEVCGVDLEVDPVSGQFTGQVARHFAPEDKAAFVEQHCQRVGITMDEVVAIGDSRSDLPLFDAVGFSVALNATPHARSAATVAVDSPSFLTALYAVPDLLL